MNLINPNRLAIIIILLINDFLGFGIVYVFSILNILSFDIFNLNNLFYFFYLVLFIIFNVYSFKTSIISTKLYLRIALLLTIYLLFISLLTYLDVLQQNLNFTFFVYFYLITFTILSRIFYIEVLKIILNFNQNKKNCLIYGAGWAGIHLSTQLTKFNIVGFIDDDQRKLSQKTINDIKIYRSEQIKKLVSEYKVEIIFLAISKISYQRKKEIINYLSQFNIECKVIPTLNELVNRNISLKDYKNINISDLIKRNYIFNDFKIKKEIQNKIVLVTGAGGSIGSEMVYQLLKFNPKLIIALDNSEYNLYQLEQDIILKNQNPSNILFKLCDIRNLDNLDKIFKENNPQYVFHTAAYKHVPILEDNIIEAITNNYLAVISLIDISIKYEIKNFLYISTDKAVRPTNIMGATKRLSEIYIQSFFTEYQKNNNNNIKFAIVRFGNVIGSAGSVLPLFNKQIEKGGPLTITHPDIERFFMTIPEAVGLVLETITLVSKGNIFVLDMGKPIKIVDLAKKFINLSGLDVRDQDNPSGDIEIKFIGLRP